MSLAKYVQASNAYLEVFMSHNDLEEREASLDIDGQRIGLLLSIDGEISISSLDGCFVQVESTGEFELDIERILKAAARYDVIVAPLLEEDAHLVGWTKIDLNAASCVAEKYGVRLIVNIERPDHFPNHLRYH